MQKQILRARGKYFVLANFSKHEAVHYMLNLHQRLWFNVLRSLVIVVAATTGIVPLAKAGSVERCRNTIHGTLKDALLKEAEVDHKASLLKGDVAQAAAEFPGWKQIPRDVKILSGPEFIQVLFPTLNFLLPSADSDKIDGFEPPAFMTVDCLVQDRVGHRWYVTHSRDGTLSYFDADDAKRSINESKIKAFGD